MTSDDLNARPEAPVNHHVPPRFQQGPLTTALHLGPLAFLNGSWRGPGFNAIWRPHNQKSEPDGNKTKRFLELNLTNDGFDFHIIPGVVPNRGVDPQPDLSLYGLHYLQRVSDADPKPSRHVHPHHYSQTAGQALHIEPGLFMHVPASSQPAVGDTPIVNKTSIVRMGSIPHGSTVLMQGPSPGHTSKAWQAAHSAPLSPQGLSRRGGTRTRGHFVSALSHAASGSGASAPRKRAEPAGSRHPTAPA